MVPMRRCTPLSSFLESAYRSRPPMAILPLLNATLRVSVRKSVDLPAPEAPMTASLSLGLASIVTPSSAGVPPNRTVTPSRASPPSGFSLLRVEEIKLPRLLFNVIVVFGLDPRVALGAQKVEEYRVLHTEEGLGDLLFQVVGEGAAGYPGVALYGVGLADDADAILYDITLVYQVVQDAVCEAATVHPPVRDRLRRCVVASRVGELREIRPVVYPCVLEHDRGVQRARGGVRAPKGEGIALYVLELFDVTLGRYDD